VPGPGIEPDGPQATEFQVITPGTLTIIENARPPRVIGQPNHYYLKEQAATIPAVSFKVNRTDATDIGATGIEAVSVPRRAATASRRR